MFKLKITSYLILITTLFCGISVFSQQTIKSPEERAQKLAAIVSKKLELNSGQSDKIYGVFLAQAQQFDELRANKPASKDELRQSVMNIRNQTDSQMQTILSSEQYQKFQDLKQKFRERLKNKKQSQKFG